MNRQQKAGSFQTLTSRTFSIRSIFFLLLVAGLVLGSATTLFQINGTKTTAQSTADVISPQALKQIEALIKEKESRTDAQKKIDSRLLYRIKMERGEAIADGVPTLESDLQVGDDGSIEVEITANVNAKLLMSLKTIRAEVINVQAPYRSILARVPLTEIENLAGRADVIFIQPKIGMKTNSVPARPPRPLVDQPSAFDPTDFFRARSEVGFETRTARVKEFLTNALGKDDLTGAVNSQADTTHRAGLARTIAGVTGAGLKIGVLSNGVDTLAARQGAGELPAGLTVLAGQAGTGDEGTAMLELVYDLAPGAQLFYATALPTNAQFAQNIRDLRTAGCDIIIDDVTYFNETPFQDGQAAPVVSPGNAGAIIQAVNDVTIGSMAGAIYFSSAANSGNKNDNSAGAWEGDFVDGGATSAPIPGTNRVHDFGGAVTQNVLTFGGRVTLKWSDPIGASSNDYDLYVLNSAGSGIAGSSSNVQSGTQDPYEDAGNRAAGQRVVIVKNTAAANRFLHLNTNGDVLTISTAGTIYGHNGSRNTMSVAATPAGPAQQNLSVGPFPGRHTGINKVEQFSSDGPRRIFYEANGTVITPGNVSSTGGQLLQKPDITAADGTSTTTPGFIPFFGTSAAAPHAGAIMALVKQASPASTRTQLINAMITSAIDIEAVGTDRDSGTGIIMPLRAMSTLGVAGPAFLEVGTPAVSEFLGNGNGRLDPGESANMFVALDNLGLTNATGVTATLSTSTPGVFIMSTLAPEALAYPTILAGVGTGTNVEPFRFGLDRTTFPCGAPISFTLTVNYTGGSTPSQVFNFTVDTAVQVSLTTTLDTTAPTGGPSFTAATGTQNNRLNRNGAISSCAAPKATPGLQEGGVGASRRYDSYTFTASATGCTTVTLSTALNNAANNMYLVVYGNGGFVPTAIQTNYLADWGTTGGGLVTVGFNATAGQQFTVVVHEINTGAGIGAIYTLTVTGPIQNACALAPTAANAAITGQIRSSEGRGIANATITLTNDQGETFVGRSNAFGFFRIEVAVGQTYFVTTEARRFTFSTRTITVSDSVNGFDIVAEP